jgi:DNA helicase-2/ATP-dependent DNA helicase PcrA
MSEFVPTAEQSAIIDFPAESVRVAAGAGTGKTTTIVRRLVANVVNGADPARALGITFTNKAADELRARLAEALPHSADGREIEVATYHSFAASILDEFGGRIGYVSGGTLIDEGHRSELAVRVLRSLSDTSLDLTALPQRRDEMLTVADALNDNLVSVEDLRRIAPNDLDDIWKKRLALAEAAAIFGVMKEDLNLIEYSDLIRNAVDIVSLHPDVAGEISGRYDSVLLDEYQDTDPAQRILLRRLFGAGLAVTAVGDTDQTIYEWRGASLENFEAFPDDFARRDGTGAKTLPLSVNRRSDRAIVTLANAVREHLPEIDGAKALRARPDAGNGNIMTAWFRTDTDESHWIAEQVSALHDDGTPFDEIAVLTRTRDGLRPIADALRIAGVPFVVGSMGDLLDSPAIADLVAWLAILAHPTNEPALLRILIGGRYRLGMSDIARVRGSVSRDQASLVDAIVEPNLTTGLSPSGADAIATFAKTYQTLLKMTQAASVARTVAELITELDYWSEVSALPSEASEPTRANINRFLELANGWKPLDGSPSLSAFLRYLDALAESGRSDALETAGLAAGDAVRLLTSHASKGLEWSHVFLPALAKDVFPSRIRDFFDPERSALVLPYGVRLDADAMADVRDERDEEARKDLLRTRHLNQEWRLAYVAVTRAKHAITLSGHAWDGEIKNPRTPSPLLTLAQSIPGVTRGPTVTDPGERPVVSPHTARIEAPDPLFEDGWDAAYRRTAHDPAWIESEYPDLARDVENKTQQLVLAAAELERPAPVTDSSPFVTSVTNLVALAECPLKFKWIHHDRLPRRPRMSAIRGTEFHKRVELHNLGIVSFDDQTGTAATKTGSAGTAAATEIVDPWVSYTQSRFFDGRPVLVETPFEITMDGRMLRGKVDAVYQRPEGWEIVDYKSGRSRESKSQLVQLQAYAVAAADGALGMPAPDRIDVSFAYFGEDPAGEIRNEATDSWLNEARAVVTGHLATAENGPFAATPSAACQWCDFLHHCKEGKAVVARMSATEQAR